MPFSRSEAVDEVEFSASIVSFPPFRFNTPSLCIVGEAVSFRYRRLMQQRESGHGYRDRHQHNERPAGKKLSIRHVMTWGIVVNEKILGFRLEL
jgi:hypothetical protein